jgi:hypothetical protein
VRDGGRVSGLGGTHLGRIRQRLDFTAGAAGVEMGGRGRPSPHEISWACGTYCRLDSEA